MMSGEIGNTQGSGERYEYEPPLIEDVNTLARYPFTLACLLAHIAIGGTAETDDIREKIQELAGGETIERPLTATRINGSSVVLQEAGLLEIEETQPEVKTSLVPASVRRGMPLIGVFGPLHCNTQDGEDIRPFLDTSSAAWTMTTKLKFFDLLVGAQDGLHGADALDQLDISPSTFYGQMEILEELGAITRKQIWNDGRLMGVRLVLVDGFRQPMAKYLTQYSGLENKAGRKLAADRAYTIMRRPHEFVQLVNTGVAPGQRSIAAKSILRRAIEEAPEEKTTEEHPIAMLEMNSSTVQILNRIGGLPVDMAYLLAHCREPSQWLSRGEARELLGDEWREHLLDASARRTMKRTCERLVALGLLERDDEQARTRLTAEGVMTGVPVIGAFADWLLGLPDNANAGKLFEARGMTTGDKLEWLTMLLNYENKHIPSFRHELGSTKKGQQLQYELSILGLINIRRRAGGKIRDIKLAPDDRPFIVDFLGRLYALQNEETAEKAALKVTAQAIANARSNEFLSDVASIAQTL